MKLVLELLGPPRLMGARRRCELSTGSLSIGRSPEAGWIIPDTERMISRLHLRVDASHGEFMLTDTSTNGVYVNGGAVPVGNGASVKLRDGDRLRVGEAQITVSILAEEPPAAGPRADPFAAQPAPATQRRDPLGGPFGTAAPPPMSPPPPASGPVPALRGGVDANWMITPLNPPPTQAPPLAAPRGWNEPSASGLDVAAASRTPQGAQRTVLSLVDGRFDLSARAIATAVDQAARSLDPSTRSAFLAEVAAALGRG